MANFQYSFIQTMMAKVDWLIKTIASTIFFNIWALSSLSGTWGWTNKEIREPILSPRITESQ